MTLPPLRPAIVILLVIAIIGGGFWYWQNSLNAQRNAFVEDIRAANEAHYGGDFLDAISAYRAASENRTVAPEEQARLRRALAFSLEVSKGEAERREAVTVYYSVINDAAASAETKAQALFDLMNRYISTYQAEDLDYASAREVFKEEPLKSLLAESGNDPWLASRKVYERAYETYPFALAAFRVADWYGQALLNGKPKSEAERMELIRQVRAWTEKGEASISASYASYDHNMRGFMYWLYGVNQRTLASVGNKDYKPAEESFKQALAELAPYEKTQYLAFNEAMITRFQYALMLAGAYGKARKDDIRVLLAGAFPVPEQFAGKNYKFTVMSFLRRERGEAHLKHEHRADVLRLVKLDAEFAEFLKSRDIAYD